MATDSPSAARWGWKDWAGWAGNLVVAATALIAAIIALIEYSDCNYQARLNTIFNSIQLAEQGQSTVVFRNQISELIGYSYTDAFANFDDKKYSNKNHEDPDTLLAFAESDAPKAGEANNMINAFIQEKIFRIDLLKFCGVLAFIDRMHQYAKFSACQWQVIYLAFESDVGTITHYFSPVLYDGNFLSAQNLKHNNIDDFLTGTLRDENGGKIFSSKDCDILPKRVGTTAAGQH